MVLENYEFPSKKELQELNSSKDSGIDSIYESYRYRFGESLENYEGDCLGELPSRVQITYNTVIATVASNILDQEQFQELEEISSELDGMGIA